MSTLLQIAQFVWIDLLIAVDGFGVNKCFALLSADSQMCSCRCKITVVWHQTRRCRNQYQQRSGLLGPRQIQEVEDYGRRARCRNKCIYFLVLRGTIKVNIFFLHFPQVNFFFGPFCCFSSVFLMEHIA